MLYSEFQVNIVVCTVFGWPLLIRPKKKCASRFMQNQPNFRHKIIIPNYQFHRKCICFVCINTLYTCNIKNQSENSCIFVLLLQCDFIFLLDSVCIVLCSLHAYNRKIKKIWCRSVNQHWTHLIHFIWLTSGRYMYYFQAFSKMTFAYNHRVNLQPNQIKSNHMKPTFHLCNDHFASNIINLFLSWLKNHLQKLDIYFCSSIFNKENYNFDSSLFTKERTIISLFFPRQMVLIGNSLSDKMLVEKWSNKNQSFDEHRFRHHLLKF